MKNSASNFDEKQALQMQAGELLPLITKALSKWGYQNITHQRISQSNNAATNYQGLTRAQHSQLNNVMIKWQLSPDNKALSDLSYEVKVLSTLHCAQQIQKNTAPIAPPVLEHKNSELQWLEQSYQLTILVMPYYPLKSLAQHLNKKNQPLSDNLKPQIIVQSAHLIANLHQQGWLHNDIKPSNFLISDELSDDAILKIDSFKTGALLLTDFALAKCLNKNVNQEYAINPAGTPAYLAPERWRGQSATTQSDIYAFGIMLNEVLTGKRAFSIASPSSEPFKAWATVHCQSPIALLPDKYQHYQPIIDKALAKRIENRYQSMEEVVKDLEEVIRKSYY